MAGIGFELKKLFSKKGVFAIIKAYGYAAIVCSGPMILGICLILGIQVLSVMGGADESTRNLLNSMITYTLFYSMFITNLFNMITTRFFSDSVYLDKKGAIMPCFYGSVSLMLILGCTTYGIFLHFSGIPLLYRLFCFILFGELIIVWTEISFLTALKDYKEILLTFFFALIAAFIAGYVLIFFAKMEVIPALMLVICLAYGSMMIWYYRLLLLYFPKGNTSMFFFLKWFDKYPSLCLVGGFLSAGLFFHLIFMWFGPIGMKIQGLFYGAPRYDVPALFAFLSTLVTTVNFVTSIEVNFYPKYKNYFGLFNFGGSLSDILQAEEEMKATLQNEMEYTFTKQLFVTLLFIILGTLFLPLLPLGFEDYTLGVFRFLCVGYALYAIGNTLMLVSLYFSDNFGACVDGAVFAVVSCVATLVSLRFQPIYFGIGFVIGSACYAVTALVRLLWYLKHLMYYVLSTQPIILEERKSFLTRFSEEMERRYQEKTKA